jgi:hypothetical protein
MLENFIARDFIAIAGEMRRYLASNENTGDDCLIQDVVSISCMKKCCCDEESSRWPFFSFGLKSSSHL